MNREKGATIQNVFLEIICQNLLSQDYLPVSKYNKKCEHILKFIYWHICYAHSIAQNNCCQYSYLPNKQVCPNNPALLFLIDRVDPLF